MKFLSLLLALLVFPPWFIEHLSAQATSTTDAILAVDKSTSASASHALLISSGDLLDLLVFDTPELSTKLRVTDRGEIGLPLAGSIRVSGLTAEQAGQAIEGRFREAKILKDPHVSVTVLEYATQGVTVVGEVKNPGVYPLQGVHGPLDLIAAAGGFTSNAGRTVTINHRSDPDRPVVANLDNQVDGPGAFGIDVRPGDTIVVSHTGIVYVMGDVGKPGGFAIERNDRLTVLQAIALAQGTNRTAALDRTKLIRITVAGREEIPVPLKKILANKAVDKPLVGNDILFVPSSAAKGTLVSIETLLPAVASASIYRVP